MIKNHCFAKVKGVLRRRFPAGRRTPFLIFHLYPFFTVSRDGCLIICLEKQRFLLKRCYIEEFMELFSCHARKERAEPTKTAPAGCPSPTCGGIFLLIIL